MDFHWMIPVIAAIMAYACICYWIKTKKILPHVFAFTGPCLMIKTEKTAFFDKLAHPKKLLMAYASAGIILTALSGIILTLLFLVSAVLTLISPPEPVAVQNLFLIPGLNEYVPSTIAVWLSLVLALIIHEGGHGILSRVENIRVKSTGLLALVIPIGAFVEPDEDDVEKAKLGTKLRMFAAGITNNLVFGAICLIVMCLLLGMVVPGAYPYVYGIYAGFPAEESGVLPGTIITAINDVPTYTLEDISFAMNGTKAGDVVRLNGEYRGEACTYDITLAAIPPELASSALTPDAGFMGISFSEPETIIDSLTALTKPESPAGLGASFLYFLVLPFKSFAGMETLSFITADSPDPAILSAPFTGFWGIIHFLFWSAWINILLGTFNAIPIRAFDGGQMLREILRSAYKKRGLPDENALKVCSGISLALIMILVLSIIVPYLF
ncbi:MAG TPA: site-2 protease family protein [Methanocorpusculum sp.]|nr:site-2 protease family protein [Methanocorpusculum sp.]